MGLGRLDIGDDGVFASGSIGVGMGSLGISVDPGDASTTALLRLLADRPVPAGTNPTHGGTISSWPDLVAGTNFTASGIVWQNDIRRGRSTAGSAGLSRATLAIGTRTRYTIAAHLAVPAGFRRFPIYTELGSDGRRTQLRVDSLGRPELAVRPASGPEVVATCPGSIAPRMAITSAVSQGRAFIRQTFDASLENTVGAPANPDVWRVRWRLNFAEEHWFDKGDEVWVSGLGAADGVTTVVNLGRTWIDVIVDRETEAAHANPTTVGARRLSGSSASNLTGALDRHFAEEWSGGSWTIAGWVKKTATTQDALASGAGIFCGWAIGDAEARPARIQIGHDGSGTPGDYRMTLGDGSAGIDLGQAALDGWRHLAITYDAATDRITSFYEGESLDDRTTRYATSDVTARLGPQSWAAATWVQLDRLDRTQDIAGGRSTPIGAGDWWLRYDGPGGGFRAGFGDPSIQLSATITNGSFEATVLAADSFVSGPPTAWGGSSGTVHTVRGTGGAAQFATAGQVAALPDGAQFAAVQQTGTLIQTVTCGASAGYTLTFRCSRRGGFSGNHTLRVLVNGVAQGADIVNSSNASWATVTRTFTLPAGSSTIEIRGINVSGDNASIVDNVTLVRSGGNVQWPLAIPAGGAAIGTPYRVLSWYDHVGKTLNVKVDAGTAVSVSHDMGVSAAGTTFHLGAAPGTEDFLFGEVDHVSLYENPPGGIAGVIASIDSETYDGGSVPTYAGLPGSYATNSGLVSWWESEPSSGAWSASNPGGVTLQPQTSALDLSANPTHASVFSGLGFGFNRAHDGRLPCDIDNWGVWLGRALAPADIAALYNGGAGVNHAGLSAGLRSGLTAWYDFDETGGDAVDASGNGNHLIHGWGGFGTAPGIGPGIAFGSASSAPFVRASGRQSIHWLSNFGDDAVYNWLRHPITVKRSGGSVSFYYQGSLLGAATLPASAVGPASGTASVLSPGTSSLMPQCNLYAVEAFEGAMTASAALTNNIGHTVLTSQDSGPVRLGVQFLMDRHRIGGLHPSEVWPARTIWEFESGDTRLLHSNRFLPSGQAYAVPTTPFCSQVFRTAGVPIKVRLTIVRPDHTREGVYQTPAILFSGVVKTIDPQNWPAGTTLIHLDTSVPGQDGNNGATEGTAVSTWSRATSLMTAPNTRLLVKRGTTVTGGTAPLQVSSKTGPWEIAPYGTGAKPILIPMIRTQDSRDGRFSDIEFRPTNADGADVLIQAGGTSGRMLFSGCDNRPGVGPVSTLANLLSGNGMIIDDCTTTGAGYIIFANNIRFLSATDIRWDGTARTTGTSDFWLGSRIQYCDDVELRGWSAPGVSRPPNLSGFGITTTAVLFTFRRQCGKFSITDSSFPLSLNSTAGYEASLVTSYSDAVNYALAQGQINFALERCELEVTNNFEGLSNAVIRDNHVGRGRTSGSAVEGFNVRADQNVRSQQVFNLRIHGNRASTGFTTIGLSGVGMPTASVPVVNEPRQVATVSDVLGPAPIAAAVASGGTGVLTATMLPSGPNTAWARHRWMVRPAGSGGAFSEIAGQVGSVLAYTAPSPGSYEFRLDAYDEIADTAAVGTTTQTLDIT